MLKQNLTEERCALFSDEVSDTPINHIIKGLIELGLTQNEAKVYLYLAKSGAKKAIEISRSLDIPRTETYHLLSKLQSKGLLMVTMQHPIKYTAIPFDKTVNMLIGTLEEKLKSFEKKKSELLVHWQELPTFAYSIEDRERMQILEGKTSVYAKAKELCSNAEERLLILASEKEILSFYHYDVLDSINKYTNVRILTNLSTKFASILQDIHADVNLNYELNSPCFIVKDYDEVLLFMDNENNKDVVALWTDCKTIIQSMDLLFERLWG